MNNQLKKMKTLVATLMIATLSFMPNVACSEEIYVSQSCSEDVCGRFVIGAEALYLRPYQGGLSGLCDHMEITDTLIEGFPVTTLVGKGKDPHANWDWGYRLGAGYYNGCGLGLGVDWTHFHSRSHHRAINWKVEYDTVDFVAAYAFESSSELVLTPFGGLKYARIQQTVYKQFSNLLNGTPFITSGYVRQTFRGVGPMLGFAIDWDMCGGFSLYGNAAVSLLYGTAPVKAFDVQASVGGMTASYVENHHKSYQTVLDVGLGIRWRFAICNANPVVLQLGLEDHRYYNHNQFSHGDFSLNGVNLGLAVEF